MKKFLAVISVLLCFFFMTATTADTLQPAALSVTYETAQFAQDVPEDFAAALAASAFAGDPCLKGAEIRADNGSVSEALMLVDHGGAQVLLAVTGTAVTPLAEDFCPGTAEITVRFIPTAEDREPDTVAFFIEDGNKAVGFSVGSSMRLCYGMETDAEGSGWFVDMGYDKGITVTPLKNGSLQTEERQVFTADIPQAAEYWTFDSFPSSADNAASLAAAHPLNSGLQFVFGCNLRTQATGKSRSLGLLSGAVPVQATGNTEAGSQLAWVEVRIGSRTAWVSEPYTVNCTASFQSSDTELMEQASQSTPVGRTARSVTLNGTDIPEGTLVYVIAESDDSLLICLPDGGMSWRMSSGTVGEVSRESVIWAATPLQLKYTE